MNVQAVNKGKWGNLSVTSGLMVFLLLGNSSWLPFRWPFRMLRSSSLLLLILFFFFLFPCVLISRHDFIVFLRSHAYMQYLRFPLDHLHSLNKYLHISPVVQAVWPWEGIMNQKAFLPSGSLQSSTSSFLKALPLLPSFLDAQGYFTV